MAFVFHHLFVVSPRGAPEANRWVQRGLIEGPGQEHAGQGTRNRRFFFHNGMVEFLWIQRPVEANRGDARRLNLAKRGNPGSCQYGIALARQAIEKRDAPFASWRYRPAYLPDDQFISISTLSDDPRFPLLFVVPVQVGSDVVFDDAPSHPLGVARIRQIELTLEEAVFDQIVNLELPDLIQIGRAPRSGLVVEFNGADGRHRLELGGR